MTNCKQIFITNFKLAKKSFVILHQKMYVSLFILYFKFTEK